MNSDLEFRVAKRENSHVVLNSGTVFQYPISTVELLVAGDACGGSSSGSGAQVRPTMLQHCLREREVL